MKFGHDRLRVTTRNYKHGICCNIVKQCFIILWPFLEVWVNISKYNLSKKRTICSCSLVGPCCMVPVTSQWPGWSGVVVAPSLQSGAQCGDWDCCRQQLLLLTRVNCEHVNTEQCRARQGEAASVYNCVEQETLISAGGGKNCQTRAQQSAEFSYVDIYLPTLHRYSQYEFDSVCKAVLRTSVSISRTGYNSILVDS